MVVRGRGDDRDVELNLKFELQLQLTCDELSHMTAHRIWT